MNGEMASSLNTLLECQSGKTVYQSQSRLDQLLASTAQQILISEEGEEEEEVADSEQEEVAEEDEEEEEVEEDEEEEEEKREQNFPIKRQYRRHRTRIENSQYCQ